MPGRSPGTLCVTNGETIDSGTNCRYRSSPPGTLRHTSGSQSKKPAVNFVALWAGYPGSPPYLDPKTNEPPAGYENQCAIKVSVALAAAGVSMERFRGAAVAVKGTRAAIRAQELAAWLKRERIDGIAFAPETITGTEWQGKIKGRTGIVYFADYWLREGEKTPSGDHIDLWNGSRMTASGLSGAITTFARFGLGINAGPGFSDLGKATTIWFWEVK